MGKKGTPSDRSINQEKEQSINRSLDGIRNRIWGLDEKGLGKKN